MKSIASAAMNPPAIKLFDDNFDPLSTKNNFEAAKFEPEPTFDNTIHDIKDNYLKNITSIDTNVSYITLNQLSLSSEHLKYNLMPWILLLSPEKLAEFTKDLSSMKSKGNTQLQL